MAHTNLQTRHPWWRSRETASDACVQDVAQDAATKISRLQTLALAGFFFWLFEFPRVAIADFFPAYANMPLFFGPFVGALALFMLLARARKLPRIHITMAIISPLATVLGLGFVFSPWSTASLACLAAIMILCAYCLVAWGSVLRTMALRDVFLLVFGALGGMGLVQLGVGLGALLAASTNMHTYATALLLILSLMPLLFGLYFMRTRGVPQTKQAFYRSSASWNPGINWSNSEFMPFVAILLISSLLLQFTNGFTLAPFASLEIDLDCLRALVVAVIAFAACALLRCALWPLETSIKLAFIAVLALTVAVASLRFFGSTGAFFAQGAWTALSDVFFCFALVFSVLPNNRGRVSFFSRYSIAVLCSGIFWAYGLGNLLKRHLGYDQQVIMLLAVLILVVPTLLLLLAITKTTTRVDKQPAETAVEADSTAVAVVNSIYRANLAPFNLTERETQIALLVAKGHNNNTASDELGISLNTVKFHLSNAYKKCGVVGRGELAALVSKGVDDA